MLTARAWRSSSTTSWTKGRSPSRRTRLSLWIWRNSKQGVRDLDHDLLTLEAQGDYAGAKKLQDEMGVVRPVLQKSFDRLQGIPTDIEPIFRDRG